VTTVRRWLLLPVLAMAVTVAGCSQQAASPGRAHQQSSPGAAASQRPSQHPSQGPSRGASPVPSRPVTKLLVLVVENHSLEQMRTQMPYTFGLARRFGYADDYVGVGYPSLPNYLAISGGTTAGVSNDGPPAEHPLTGRSVFGEAIAAGRTAAVYADGMPTSCALEDGGDDYAVKHNPWAYYRSERDLCLAHDVPVSRLPAAVARGTLPNAGLVVPNMCHDAHDCDLSVADRWIERQMKEVLAGPDWRSGHLAVVITADTDDRHSGNRVLTVVVHPSQRGNVVSRHLDHYSLARLYSDVLQVPRLEHAASAPSMSKAFGLPLG
jgi:phosphatidylinositol-3-phosphatase